MAESTQPDNSVQSLIFSGHMYGSFLSLKDYAQQPVSFPCKCNAHSAALSLSSSIPLPSHRLIKNHPLHVFLPAIYVTLNYSASFALEHNF